MRIGGVAAVVVCALGASSAQAAAITWDDGAGETDLLNRTWGAADNWSNDAVPTASDDVTIGFDPGGNWRIQLEGIDRQVKTLALTSPRRLELNEIGSNPDETLTIADGAITTGGGPKILVTHLDIGASSPTWTLNASNTHFFETITGSGVITVESDNTNPITLRADSTATFTGDWVINSGNLQSGNGGLGQSAGQSVTVRSGATLSQHIPNAVSGNYSLQLDGGGTLDLRSSLTLDATVTGDGTIRNATIAGTDPAVNGLLVVGDSSGFTGDIVMANFAEAANRELTVSGALGTTDIALRDNTTLNGNGTLIFRIHNDQVSTILVGDDAADTAALDISGLDLQVVQTGVQTMTEYVLADYSFGSLLGGSFAGVDPAVEQVFLTGTTNNPGDLIVLQVPEPASLALLGLGGLAMLPRGRSGRERRGAAG